MHVNEYFKELDSLMIRVWLEESNREKITRFMTGLRGDIQDQVKLYEYATLTNVLHLMLKIKIQSKRKGGGKEDLLTQLVL